MRPTALSASKRAPVHVILKPNGYDVDGTDDLGGTVDFPFVYIKLYINRITTYVQLLFVVI